MPNLPLSDIATFLSIVEHGTLRAAAKALGVKPPAVSYRLKRLEDEVGAALLLRSTRSMELTDAGRKLLKRSEPALREISAALMDARRTSEEPSGTLRLTLSHVAFHYTLADHLAAFQACYPDIEVDLSFDDAVVDLAAGGFHAGVRVGDRLDQDMIAIRLTAPRRIAHVAAPEYLERRGRPASPADLLDHDCIRYRFERSNTMLEWEFPGAEGPVYLDVVGKIIVNSTPALVDAARLGLGIAWLSEKIVARDIRSGCLEVILNEYATERPPFFIYFPKEYSSLAPLRALVDFLKSANRTRAPGGIRNPNRSE